MKKKKDWVAEWFPIMRENGECTDICFGVSDEEGTIDWKFYPHDDFDGMSVLFKTMEELDLSIETKRKFRDRPNIWQYLIGILSYLKFSSLRRPNWLYFNPEKKGERQVPATLIFSSAELDKLASKAGDKNVNITILLFQSLHHLVADRFIFDRKRVSLWLIPIDVRRENHRREVYGNFASHSVIPVRESDGLLEMNKNLQDLLKKYYHFGAWAFIHIGKIIGINGMKKILKKYHTSNHSWCGTFSNLGRFSVSDRLRRTFHFCPPVTKAHPIGIGALTIDNVLTLSCIIHPVLDSSGVNGEDLLTELKSRLMLECE